MVIIEKNQINLVKVIVVITISVTLIFGGIVVTQNIKYSEFIRIDAKIIKLLVSENTSNMSRSYRIVYEYTYNGKIYTASRGVFTSTGHAIGTSETIRCNPNNPQEIEDILLTNTSIAIAIFSGVISLLSILGIYQYYNNKKKNRYIRYE